MSTDPELTTTPTPDDRDRGSAITIVLIFMVVAGLIVIPLMTFSMSVLRANSVLTERTHEIESAKAGLRVALADPVSLYEECGKGGPSVPVTLARVDLSGLSVNTSCYFVDFASAQNASEKHFGLVTTAVGQRPPTELTGTVYTPTNASSDNEWQTATNTQPVTGTIWAPNLPVHSLTRRAATGYQLPAGYPSCTVFFPGSYVDPITINGPAFFTSGIYYFENEVRITSGANVVVGMGAEQGCSDDQEAAFYAVNAPANHNINGLGATFVFGAAGRLVVTDAASTSPISLVFNQRYVQPGDTGAAPSQGVSIATVNGLNSGSGLTELNLPGINRVPLSVVADDGAQSAASQSYLPSTLTLTTSSPLAGTGVTTPVIDVSLTRSVAHSITINGYVAIPQGVFKETNTTGRAVSVSGGILAAAFQVADGRAGSPVTPQSVPIGYLESIVQRTFRIVSTAGRARSTAIVQVNQNGAYAVNSWEVQ